MRLLLFSIAIISISLFTFSCQQPQPMEVESGVSKTLADHRKATLKNVEYDLEFFIPDSLNKKIIIMHPGPINRGVELAGDVADSEHSIILQQVENGVAIRMAVLFLLAAKR